MDDSPEDGGWVTASTCHIAYWNRCTLWGWAWSGFGEKARIGVVTENCCAPGLGAVVQTRHWFFADAPAGYGFTGTLSVSGVDANDCPSGIVASQPFLPAGFPGVVPWSAYVPRRFAVVMTLEDGDGGLPNPALVATDHPAAGATGPAACGFCYPIDRENHSFSWGTLETPLCPGRTFHDGTCDAQLRWSIFVGTEHCTVSVPPYSWGAIKSLYR